MDPEIANVLKQLTKDPFIINYVNSVIRDNFDEIKNDILAQFNTHPVTLELEGGINSSNISGTLSGVTNLYSFIGFENGEKPTEPIREMLHKSSFAIKNISATGIITINFDIPSAESIFKVTPMPWAEGRSWAKGIETGISGLGYYLKINKNSRSGLGIQSQKQVRSARFNNTKYISALINDFNVKIKGLEKIQL
jgi:hypothetical protein